MYYIKYAYKYVNLVSASHTECVEIRDNITTFFKKGLTLNKDKTLITNMRKHFKWGTISNNPNKDYVVYDKGTGTWKKPMLSLLKKLPSKN